MPGSRVGRLLLICVLLLAVIAAAGCAPDPETVTTKTSARVAVAPDGLRLDGRAWWPAGFNAYQLGTNYTVNRGCGAVVDLDVYFGSLPSRSLTRFDAFQSLATNKSTGRLDFTALDAVFAAAERHGQLLIPVLVAQDGACEDEQFKSASWFTGGWREPTTQALSFENWIRVAVARWSASSALAAWETIGEAEPAHCAWDECQIAGDRCPANAAQVLRDFLDDAGAVVRQYSSAPISGGSAGGGQCGTQGDEYAYVAASSGIDLVQYHDYSEGPAPLPGDQWNGLARRLEQAKQVGKPLLIGEIGEPAGSCRSVDQRAADLESRIEGQRAAGAAGALVWAFVPDPREQECTLDVGPADPLYRVVAAQNTA